MDQIPNSVLLISGKKEDALALAKQLFGQEHIPKIDSGNHPDIHIYVPEGKSHLHSIAQMQKLIHEMSFPPFEAEKKIFIIEEAEKMLPSSSNALLKTLEEPHEDTFFFLLTDAPEKLLPTVRSRLYPFSYKNIDPALPNLDHYFEMVEKKEWDVLLDEPFEIEPSVFFQAYLRWILSHKKPSLFKIFSSYIEEAQIALQHHVKPRNVFLDLLLKI